jgi:hypothetical protein
LLYDHLITIYHFEILSSVLLVLHREHNSCVLIVQISRLKNAQGTNQSLLWKFTIYVYKYNKLCGKMQSLNDNCIAYNKAYKKYFLKKQQLFCTKFLRVSNCLCNHQAYKIYKRRLVV